MSHQSSLAWLKNRLATLDSGGVALPIVHILYDVGGGRSCSDRMAFVMPQWQAAQTGPIRALLINVDAQILGWADLPLLRSKLVESPDKRLTRGQAARRLDVSVSSFKRLEPEQQTIRLDALPGWEPPQSTDTLTLTTERRVNRRGGHRKRGDKSLPVVTVTDAAGVKKAIYRVSTVIPDDVPGESLDGVYAWLMSPDGHPCVDALGTPAVTALDALGLWQIGITGSDSALLSYAELVKRTGVSLSTLKRGSPLFEVGSRPTICGCVAVLMPARIDRLVDVVGLAESFARCPPVDPAASVSPWWTRARSGSPGGWPPPPLRHRRSPFEGAPATVAPGGWLRDLLMRGSRPLYPLGTARSHIFSVCVASMTDDPEYVTPLSITVNVNL